MPRSFQHDAVVQSHEGHMAMTKWKALIRSKLWFPGMDDMVEEEVSKCVPCQLVARGEIGEPVKSTIMPEKPWEFLRLPNGKELVLTDKHSRFPVTAVCTTTAAEYVVPKFDEVLSLLGYPVEIALENGPPFNGERFAEY